MKSVFKICFIAIFASSIMSCASILNPTYQTVTIDIKDSDELIVEDDKKFTKKSNEVKLKRDQKPKQLVLKKEGYKDQYEVIIQTKKSPLVAIPYIISIASGITFAYLTNSSLSGFSIATTGFLGSIYLTYLDAFPKSWDYKKNFEFENNRVKSIKRNEISKEIEIYKVGVDLEKGDIKIKNFLNYNHYLNFKDTREPVDESLSEDIKIENTEFSNFLNEILIETGFVDTSKNVLRNSYINNLLIQTTIENYTIYFVKNNSIFSRYPGGLISTEIEMQWEILDYYKKPIYTEDIKTMSGDFAYNDNEEVEEALEKAIKDAIEIALLKVMANEEVQKLMNDKESAKKESFADLSISKSSSYVDNIEQAVKSTVTITCKEGFGSGFFISEDGYIITNYHVIADSTNLEVVLNDKSTYKGTVVGISKALDIAIIKIDVEDIIPFDILSSEKASLAKEIYAIGTPTSKDLSQTISKGIISGLRPYENGINLIQTDASINSGNSGGPLVSKNGSIIGIVSSKVFGFGVEGVAFGIPINTLFENLELKIEK